jgi:hypothetical protein
LTQQKILAAIAPESALANQREMSRPFNFLAGKVFLKADRQSKHSQRLITRYCLQKVGQQYKIQLMKVERRLKVNQERKMQKPKGTGNQGGYANVA